MKSILCLLALALALALATVSATDVGEVEQPDELQFNLYEKMAHAAIHEAEVLADDIVKYAEHQLLEIVLYPVQELEQAVADIDARRQESEECVAAETLHVVGTVETATIDFYTCGHDATATSIQLILDTKKAVYQLTFGGYSLIQDVRTCRGYSSNTMKKICKSKLAITGALFAVNAQKSIRHLIGLRKTVPAVGTDAKACTLNATEKAMQEFGLVNENIDICIYNLTH